MQVLADEKIAVTQIGSATLSPPSPLNAEILKAVEKLTQEFWPGIPVIPTMLAVKSFYQGVEYLYRLVKDLSGGR